MNVVKCLTETPNAISLQSIPRKVKLKEPMHLKKHNKYEFIQLHKQQSFKVFFSRTPIIRTDLCQGWSGYQIFG